MGNILRKSIQVGGRALTLETGRMAKQEAVRYSVPTVIQLCW